MPFNFINRSFRNRPRSGQNSISPRRRSTSIESLENRLFLNGITPSIVSDNVPSELIGGQALHSTVKVNLTDSLPTIEQGFTLGIYAAPTPTFDATADTLVTNLISPKAIKPTKTISEKVQIKGLPVSLPNGTYYLIATVTDLSGDTESTATNSTVTVAAPFIALSETVTSTFPPALVSGSNIKGSVKLSITNNGNVPSKGVVAINLTASTTAGVGGTSITTTTKKLNIPVGKTVSVTVPVKTLPVLADGTYFIVAEVTDPNGDLTLGSSAPLTIAAPFITLSASLGAIGNIKSGDTVFVTNAGNVADSTHLHGTFGFSLDAAGLQPVGGTVTLTSGHLNIKPGKTVTYRVKPDKAFLRNLEPGVPYFLTLTFSDDTGNSGSTVSPDSFTI